MTQQELNEFLLRIQRICQKADRKEALQEIYTICNEAYKEQNTLAGMLGGRLPFKTTTHPSGLQYEGE